MHRPSNFNDYRCLCYSGSPVTVGYFPSLNTHALSTFSAMPILPQIYARCLSIINPSAKGISEQAINRSLLYNGLVYTRLARKVLHKAQAASLSRKSFIDRHIISRICFSAYAVTSVITRTADLALDIFAVAASVVTLGLIKRINTFAITQLSFLKCIGEVSIGLRLALNPSSGIYTEANRIQKEIFFLVD